MVRKKKTPIKRSKQPQGRLRKQRIKLDLSARSGNSISHSDKMKMVLLAETGKSPSEIV